MSTTGSNRDKGTTRDRFRFNRRQILKTVGATAVAGGVTTGVASAHDVDEVHFCGCSQVCASGEGRATIIIACETKDGFKKRTETRCFPFCLEVSECKIIAIKEDDNTICNPNTCAQRAQEDLGITCDNEDVTIESGGCGKPPGEKPGKRRGHNR